jgi:hypothetical protein
MSREVGHGIAKFEYRIENEENGRELANALPFSSF